MSIRRQSLPLYCVAFPITKLWLHVFLTTTPVTYLCTYYSQIYQNFKYVKIEWIHVKHTFLLCNLTPLPLLCDDVWLSYGYLSGLRLNFKVAKAPIQTRFKTILTHVPQKTKSKQETPTCFVCSIMSFYCNSPTVEQLHFLEVTSVLSYELLLITFLQYLVCPLPLAWTARMRLFMLCTTRLVCPWSIPPTISWQEYVAVHLEFCVLDRLVHFRLQIVPQASSGFKSELFAGQSRVSMPSVSRKSVVMPAVCGLALSCIKKNPHHQQLQHTVQLLDAELHQNDQVSLSIRTTDLCPYQAPASIGFPFLDTPFV